MTQNNASNVGKPDTSAFEFIRAVKALKDAEELPRVLGVEPYSIVPNKKHRLILIEHAADLDFRPLPRPGVFHRIIDQIHPHLSQHDGIALHLREVPDLPVNVPARHL